MAPILLSLLLLSLGFVRTVVGNVGCVPWRGSSIRDFTNDKKQASGDTEKLSGHSLAADVDPTPNFTYLGCYT